MSAHNFGPCYSLGHFELFLYIFGVSEAIIFLNYYELCQTGSLHHRIYADNKASDQPRPVRVFAICICVWSVAWNLHAHSQNYR